MLHRQNKPHNKQTQTEQIVLEIMNFRGKTLKINVTFVPS
jgi:hypothetical protein